MLDLIHQLLSQYPSVSEHQLLKYLHEQGVPDFANANLRDPQNLFRCHFLLFNALYRLQNQLNQNQQASLSINPLNISLSPWQQGSAALSLNDSLRSYYLEMDNLPQDQHHAAELLSGALLKLTQQDKVMAALNVLGITNSDLAVDSKTIRNQYRRLVCLHHPDRGGDKAKLQEVHQAMDILKELGIYHS